MRKFTRALLSTVLLGFGASQGAYAELAMKGLPHPVNKFPVWFKDSHNVTLQLCLADDPLCISAPVEVGNSFSEQIGFGAEGFWWAANASVATNAGQAQIDLALEAAFGQEVPKDGDQFAFGRVRIRIDTPVAGTYKIWHPYLPFPACQPEEYTVPAGRRAINVTRDIGGVAPFDAMLNGEVGPFLVWDPAESEPPAGYVGDPGVPHSVTGSPCGFNFFRVEGPAGSNIGGESSSANIVETAEFSVMGKIYNSTTTPAPVVIDGATFYRNEAGTSARLNVWAESDPDATLTRSGQPGASQVMEKDISGGYFNRKSYSNSNCKLLQPTVTVTAVNSGNLTTTESAALTDSVKISSAVFTPTKSELKVVATTSDLYKPASPNPSDPLNGMARKLTARAGSMVLDMTPDAVTAGKYSATFTGMSVPPAKVVVTSDLGGKDEETVTP